LGTKVTVRLFHELRTRIGQSEIGIEADTLNGVVQSLISGNDDVKSLLFDAKGELRHNVMFYVNNSIQNPPDLSRKLNDRDLILLVPPAAGG
jgi:MoaD family protein